MGKSKLQYIANEELNRSGLKDVFKQMFAWKRSIGTVTGRILTVEKMSAVEGTSATLQCFLLYTSAKVTQVTWKKNDHLLTTLESFYGSFIYPLFRNMNLALGHSITLLSLTTNDTGEYHCDFHTFPDGIYRGNIFLEVTELSLPGDSAAETSDSYHSRNSFGIMVSVVVIIVATVIIMVILGVKRKLFRINAVNNSFMGRSPSRQNELRPNSLDRCLQIEATPMTIRQDYKQENDIAESHEYSNILSYRSLRSFTSPLETG
ncbi:LOW QUALITY PROTEIN: T-cell immunoreceptor with Ig and ITIM domains [Macrotis lagotis]|uniref:LOW QUALITY PROTEIN: T-cell immunoreceptor with Ig and ITIM domains n=1 Tax=Macrotis lagotis TaxID=92651 RepID=UPI003D69EDE8